MSDNASLNLQRFYPLELEILSVEAGDGQRVFRMRSNSTSSQCQIAIQRLRSITAHTIALYKIFPFFSHDMAGYQCT